MLLQNEDGVLNLQYVTTDGAFNMKNPKNNSTQDYIGSFEDPTIPKKDLNNEEFSWLDSKSGATDEVGIKNKDDNQSYLSDYEYGKNSDNKEPTIRDKYYKFIQENFDFLD